MLRCALTCVEQINNLKINVCLITFVGTTQRMICATFGERFDGVYFQLADAYF